MLFRLRARFRCHIGLVGTAFGSALAALPLPTTLHSAAHDSTLYLAQLGRGSICRLYGSTRLINPLRSTAFFSHVSQVLPSVPVPHASHVAASSRMARRSMSALCPTIACADCFLLLGECLPLRLLWDEFVVTILRGGSREW